MTFILFFQWIRFVISCWLSYVRFSFNHSFVLILMYNYLLISSVCQHCLWHSVTVFVVFVQLKASKVTLDQFLLSLQSHTQMWTRIRKTEALTILTSCICRRLMLTVLRLRRMFSSVTVCVMILLVQLMWPFAYHTRKSIETVCWTEAEIFGGRRLLKPLETSFKLETLNVFSQTPNVCVRLLQCESTRENYKNCFYPSA